MTADTRAHKWIEEVDLARVRRIQREHSVDDYSLDIIVILEIITYYYLRPAQPVRCASESVTKSSKDEIYHDLS